MAGVSRIIRNLVKEIGMDLFEGHKRRVASFPDDVRQAHQHSINHRVEINNSNQCGCFYCCSIFTPNQIEDWTDEVNGEGQTALCPSCGIDSVIGDSSGFEISKDFLGKMRSYWFSVHRT
jgi:hypothetical protein